MSRSFAEVDHHLSYDVILHEQNPSQVFTGGYPNVFIALLEIEEVFHHEGHKDHKGNKAERMARKVYGH